MPNNEERTAHSVARIMLNKEKGKAFPCTPTVINTKERMTYSVAPAMLNKLEGATHHSMVLTSSREVGMTAYLIGPAMQDR